MYDGKLEVNKMIDVLDKKVQRIFQGKLTLPNYNIVYDTDHSKHLASVEYQGVGDAFSGYSIQNIQMNLNPYLLDEFKDIYVQHVIPHEFAHIVLNQCYSKEDQAQLGIEEHGREFKIVCDKLGFGHVGSATTSIFSGSQYLNAKSINERPYFDYKCQCKNHKIGSANHMKMMNGGECNCKLCKHPLVRMV